MYIQTNTGLGQVTPVRPLTEREVTLVAKNAGDLWGDKLGNIDVFAQKALVRLSKNPFTAADAHELLNAVKNRKLRGIFIENQKVPALRAQKLGTWYGKLIPAGEDAVVVPAPAGLTEPPLIAFRDSVKVNPARLDPALVKARAKLFPAGGILNLEVAGLEAVGVLPTWEVIAITTGGMISRRTARSLSARIPLNTPVRITMIVPRPAYLPPTGEWLRVDQAVMLAAPDGAIIPLGAVPVSPNVGTLAWLGIPAVPLHPLVTLEPRHTPLTLNVDAVGLLGDARQTKVARKMVFHVEFMEVTDEVGKDTPDGPTFKVKLIDECNTEGVKFRVFQETSRSRKDLWAVAYNERTLVKSKLIHCLLHLRHRGESGHIGKVNGMETALPRKLDLFDGGLGTLWSCEPDSAPFFIMPNLACKNPGAGFVRQLSRAGKPLFMATPLTNPKKELRRKEVQWLGLVGSSGAPRERMEALARAIISKLPVTPGLSPPEVSQMRLALAGWSFGASGAIQVLAAHANDIDELYWFDPPGKVARAPVSHNTLKKWLSKRGTRGPRYLRLIGGIENETFSRLRQPLKSQAKHFNAVHTMIVDRFWENSASYKLAISVPPIRPVPNPDALSCSSLRSGQPGCTKELTPLSRDTGVFLSNIKLGVGVEIIGKDRAGKQIEPPLTSGLSLAELHGLLRFSFRSPIRDPIRFGKRLGPNLGSSGPLYEGTGSDHWTLARLTQELETIVKGADGFRHRWTVAGGVYPGGTPSVPTNGPEFRGFLQMCLMEGSFPNKKD